MDNYAPEKKQKMTLDMLAYRKQTVLADIRKQKEVINTRVKDMTAPFKPDPAKTSLMKSMDMGMSLVSGLMFSVKVFRKIKKVFKGLG